MDALVEVSLEPSLRHVDEVPRRVELRRIDGEPTLTTFRPLHAESVGECQLMAVISGILLVVTTSGRSVAWAAVLTVVFLGSFALSIRLPRAAVLVSTSGITVRGILRTRHMAWSAVDRVEIGMRFRRIPFGMQRVMVVLVDGRRQSLIDWWFAGDAGTGGSDFDGAAGGRAHDRQHDQRVFCLRAVPFLQGLADELGRPERRGSRPKP